VPTLRRAVLASRVQDLALQPGCGQAAGHQWCAKVDKDHPPLCGMRQTGATFHNTHIQSVCAPRCEAGFLCRRAIEERHERRQTSDTTTIDPASLPFSHPQGQLHLLVVVTLGFSGKRLRLPLLAAPCEAASDFGVLASARYKGHSARKAQREQFQGATISITARCCFVTASPPYTHGAPRQPSLS
jgi:hypothetical protein